MSNPSENGKAGQEPDGMRWMPRLMDKEAMAAALSVSPHTISAWVRKGKIHPTRICRRLLFSPSEIERLIREAHQAP